MATYKATGRALLDYAVPVWAPGLHASHVLRLQAAQNAALRLSLGCHKMAHIDHLHAECKMLKVKEHMDLIAAQYLAACYSPSHPCHELAFPGAFLPKRVYTSLGHRYRHYVEANRVFDPGGDMDCGATRARIHTAMVASALGPAVGQGHNAVGREVNRLLRVIPPVVSGKEGRLNRRARSTLFTLGVQHLHGQLQGHYWDWA